MSLVRSIKFVIIDFLKFVWVFTFIIESAGLSSFFNLGEGCKSVVTFVNEHIKKWELIIGVEFMSKIEFGIFWKVDYRLFCSFLLLMRRRTSSTLRNTFCQSLCRLKLCFLNEPLPKLQQNRMDSIVMPSCLSCLIEHV